MCFFYIYNYNNKHWRLTIAPEKNNQFKTLYLYNVSLTYFEVLSYWWA